MKKSSAISKFPISRGRRLRHSSWIRSLTSETELNVNDLVQPLFVREDKVSSSNIIGMPGLKRLSFEELKREVSSIVKLGIKAIAIFPVIHESSKTTSAKEALNCGPFPSICTINFPRSDACSVAVPAILIKTLLLWTTSTNESL